MAWGERRGRERKLAENAKLLFFFFFLNQYWLFESMSRETTTTTAAPPPSRDKEQGRPSDRDAELTFQV